MVAFILRRILLLVLILFAVSVITFAIVNILPGDVANAILGDMATPEQVAGVRERLGLNEPLVTRYVDWIGSALTGDLGTSLSYNTPIGPIILQRLSNSMVLAVLLLVVLIPSAIVLGVVSAVRQGGMLDRIILGMSVVFHALPEFVIGLTLILLFSIMFPILPGSSFMTPGANALANPSILVLPVAVLALHQLANLAQITRASMIATLDENFIRSAVLKGLPGYAVVFRHALPNALAPVIAELGMSLGYVLGGLVVVETLFSYPGLGQFLMSAVETRDVPALQSAVLVVAAAYGVGNLLADVAVMALNPRLRLRR